MEAQLVIQALGTLLLAVCGLLLKDMRDEVKGVRERLHTLEGGQTMMLAVLRLRGILTPDDVEREDARRRNAA